MPWVLLWNRHRKCDSSLTSYGPDWNSPETCLRGQDDGKARFLFCQQTLEENKKKDRAPVSNLQPRDSAHDAEHQTVTARAFDGNEPITDWLLCSNNKQEFWKTEREEEKSKAPLEPSLSHVSLRVGITAWKKHTDLALVEKITINPASVRMTSDRETNKSKTSYTSMSTAALSFDSHECLPLKTERWSTRAPATLVHSQYFGCLFSASWKTQRQDEKYLFTPPHPPDICDI